MAGGTIKVGLLLIFAGFFAACSSGGGSGSSNRGAGGSGTNPPPSAPTISLFASDQATITEGDSTTLTWKESGATLLQLSEVEVKDTPQSASGSVVVAPEVTTTYTLTATNLAGPTQKSVTVTVTPAFRLSGVHGLTPKSAIAWADSAHALEMWRVDVSGTGANAKAQWTKEPIPDELVAFKRQNGNGDYLVTVNFGPDGAIRLFWIEGDCEELPRDIVLCSTTIHQAESTDEGNTWQISRTKLASNPPMDGVQQCAMVDDQHGWMILSSEPGAGMLPEMLVTTSDGGRTWKQITGVDGAGTQMPIGENLSQLLIVRSPTEASFVAGRHEYENLPDQLVATQTKDGGQTWAPAAILFPSLPYGLSGLQNGQTPGRVCFDADLFKMFDQSGTAQTANKRFCSSDGGINWLSPVPTPEPTATVGDTGRGLENGASLPIFADTQLGFALVWGDHKTANWRDGDQAGFESWREYRLYETTDGGKTWKPAPMPIANRYKPTDNVQITQAETQGDSAWLVVKAHGDAGLFYSADHGATWQLLPSSDGNSVYQRTNRIPHESGGAAVVATTRARARASALTFIGSRVEPIVRREPNITFRCPNN